MNKPQLHKGKLELFDDGLQRSSARGDERGCCREAVLQICTCYYLPRYLVTLEVIACLGGGTQSGLQTRFHCSFRRNTEESVGCLTIIKWRSCLRQFVNQAATTISARAPGSNTSATTTLGVEGGGIRRRYEILLRRLSILIPYNTTRRHTRGHSRLFCHSRIVEQRLLPMELIIHHFQSRPLAGSCVTSSDPRYNLDHTVKDENE